VFSQQWEGDVTIVLPHTFLQLWKAVVNPSNADLLRAVRQGELCTWAKLSAIQCNCGIEATLDACIQQVGGCAEEGGREVGRRQRGGVG
jgi:TAG lipase/steryl ester hydrolase/phospholipase A2/LPA acyltransferase